MATSLPGQVYPKQHAAVVNTLNLTVSAGLVGADMLAVGLLMFFSYQQSMESTPRVLLKARMISCNIGNGFINELACVN